MNSTDLPPSAYPPSGENTGERMAWHEVWSEVITHPSRETFRRILADPGAGPARAFIWVGLIGLILGILQAVVGQVVGANALGQLGGGAVLTNIACTVLLTPILSVAGLAIGSAIYRGVASLFGGTGNFNNMVYAIGSASAPLSIISGLLSLVSTVLTGGALAIDPTTAAPSSTSMLGLCLAPLLLAVGVYGIVLQVKAVGTVENLTTGKATATVLIPVLVMILLFGCLFAVLGAAFFSALQQMQ